MPDPTPETPTGTETPTDIYDRLRGLGRRPRPRPQPGRLIMLTLLTLVALVTGSACSPPPTEVDGVPTRVCGTIADPPIRVLDDRCPVDEADVANTTDGPVRWYPADHRCLERDDYTEVGHELNDDYTEGSAACDGDHHAPALPPIPPPTTPTATRAPAAPTTTIAPRPTTADQAPAATPARPAPPRKPQTVPRKRSK
jgi:hypothetical protein